MCPTERCGDRRRIKPASLSLGSVGPAMGSALIMRGAAAPGPVTEHMGVIRGASLDGMEVRGGARDGRSGGGVFGTSNRLIGIVVAGDDTSCLRFPCRFCAAPQSPSNAADRHHGDSSDGFDVCRNERVGSSPSGLRESPVTGRPRTAVVPRAEPVGKPSTFAHPYRDGTSGSATGRICRGPHSRE